MPGWLVMGKGEDTMMTLAEVFISTGVDDGFYGLPSYDRRGAKGPDVTAAFTHLLKVSGMGHRHDDDAMRHGLRKPRRRS